MEEGGVETTTTAEKKADDHERMEDDDDEDVVTTIRRRCWEQRGRGEGESRGSAVLPGAGGMRRCVGIEVNAQAAPARATTSVTTVIVGGKREVRDDDDHDDASLSYRRLREIVDIDLLLHAGRWYLLLLLLLVLRNVLFSLRLIHASFLHNRCVHFRLVRLKDGGVPNSSAHVCASSKQGPAAPNSTNTTSPVHSR